MIRGLTSVIFPTTGRTRQAIACLNLLVKTTAPHKIEICAAVDADPETVAVLTGFEVLARKLWPHLTRVSIDIHTHYRGQPRAWNAGLQLSRGEYVVFAADDLRWTDGWLTAALECMKTLPPGGGLVGLNDLHRTFAMRKESTHYVASRWFVVNYLNGCLGFPHYAGACNDSEACGRARLAERYVPCYDAVVEHVHYDNGLRKMDNTDLMWFPSKQRSRREFERRQRIGFPNDFEPAITAESLELEDA